MLQLPALSSYGATLLHIHLKSWLIRCVFVFMRDRRIYKSVGAMAALVFGRDSRSVSVLARLWSSCFGERLRRKFARDRAPLSCYGMIESACALRARRPCFAWSISVALMWEQFHPGFYAFSVWRFVLSCAVLLAPTTLMGATLPVLSAALLRRPSVRQPVSAVARLYTCNLVGAIFGTLVAGFLLLPLLGVRATVWTAAAINIVVGLASYLIDLKGAEALTTSGEDREREKWRQRAERMKLTNF